MTTADFACYAIYVLALVGLFFFLDVNERKHRSRERRVRDWVHKRGPRPSDDDIRLTLGEP